MPGESGDLAVTMLVCSLPFCTRGCGCGGHPAFPTPSVGRKVDAQLGHFAPRDRGLVSVTSLRSRSCFITLDCFASLATTDGSDHALTKPLDGGDLAAGDLDARDGLAGVFDHGGHVVGVGVNDVLGIPRDRDMAFPENQIAALQ